MSEDHAGLLEEHGKSHFSYLKDSSAEKTKNFIAARLFLSVLLIQARYE